jgi:hypothetical protein
MKSLLAIVLLAVLSCTAAWGQATAQMHGTVVDSSGAAVAGAEIKATQTETGLARTVQAGADGGFVLTNLPLGPYQVEVTKDGFTKYVQSGIVLQVNSDPVVTAALKVGQVTEQVLVEANATQVETRSSGIGEVVQTQRIVDLPLNGRNVTDLITLAGGAVNSGNIRGSFFLNLPMISIAGQAASGEPFGTDYSLDGANHVNFMTGTTMPIAFPDAVQEFKVESSGQQASHGSAAAITIVTRSGGNDFHGNLFEFIRNSGLGSAREYFSAGVFSYKRNQWGGTVGGPIIKNKLFFFAGLQGTGLRSNPNNTITFVPTPTMLAGDWTAFASAACNGGVAKAPLRGAFNNTYTINPGLYSAPAVYIADKIVGSLGGITPNQCGQITYNTPDAENYIQGVSKVDYQLNDKQSVFFRVLETHNLMKNAFSITPNLLTAATTGLDQLGQSFALGHTYVLTPNVVNSLRVAFDRTASGNIENPSFDFCDAGLINYWCGAQNHELGGVIISGGFTAGGGAGGSQGKAYFNVNSGAVNDDVNWVKGNHQIAIGGGVLRGQYSSLNDFAGAGQFTFNGSVTGIGMADFFTGAPSSFMQGLPNTSASRQNFFNLYVTDSWKITPRLTLNFGIRWEPYLPMSVSNGQISNFSMARFLTGASEKSTVFLNAPYGFYFPGDPGFPGTDGIYKQWAHFDPRGGLAWDPKGNGKTSVRAGYAFGYAYVPGITRQDQAGSNPWGGRSTFAQTGTNFQNPYAAISGGNPYPYSITPNVQFTQAGQFITNDYNLGTPVTYSYNLAVQQQIGTTWVVSASYIGSRMQHLAINQPINYAELLGTPLATGCAATALTCSGTSNTQARRVLSVANASQGQFVGNMDQWQPAGTQIYNGLLTSVQKRLSHGLNLSGNWTWSHCIGVFQGYDSKSDQTSTMYGNLDFDRGNCDADRRHIVNITAVYLTPKLANKAMRWVLSDWQVSGIYRFTSGTPLSIQDGTGVDRELSGINHQRPTQVLPNAYTGNSGPNQYYFNYSAFAQVCSATVPAPCQPLGTFGSLGWNSVVGPTFWDMDFALSRIFRFHERHSVEIRADAFNLTNSFVSMPPGTAAPGNAVVPAFEGVNNSSTFGLNNTAQPTRKIQFALKYSF